MKRFKIANYESFSYVQKHFFNFFMNHNLYITKYNYKVLKIKEAITKTITETWTSFLNVAPTKDSRMLVPSSNKDYLLIPFWFKTLLLLIATCYKSLIFDHFHWIRKWQKIWQKRFTKNANSYTLSILLCPKLFKIG